MFDHGYFGLGWFDGNYWNDAAVALLRGTNSWDCTPRSENLPDGTSGSAETFDCYAIRGTGNNPCIWCGPWDDEGPTGGVRPDQELFHCMLGFQDTNFSPRRRICEHLVPGVVGPIAGDGLLITPKSVDPTTQETSWDAFGDTAAFNANGSGKSGHSALYLHDAELLVSPCLVTDADTSLYCAGPPFQTLDEFEAKWLCNWHVHNGGYEFASGTQSNWEIFCNTAIQSGDGAHADQLVGRPFTLKLNGRRDTMFITFNLGRRAPCFSLRNQYYFTQNIDCSPNIGDPDPPLWKCDPSFASSLRILLYSSSALLSQDHRVYPHANRDTIPNRTNWWEGEGDIWLRNMVLENYGETVNTLYHTSKESIQDNEQYWTNGLNLWTADEFQSGIPAGFGNDLRVRYFDGSRFGAVIPISVISLRTRCVFPAYMELTSQTTTLRMNWQKEPWIYYDHSTLLFRILSTVDIDVNLRVLLEDSAYDVSCPYKFYYRPDGPEGSGAFDRSRFEFEDPANPGTITTDEAVIFAGPNGEHVPLNVKWRGIRGPYPFARGSDYDSVSANLGGFTVLGEINAFPYTSSPGGAVVQPTLDDGTLVPDRYQGGILT